MIHQQQATLALLSFLTEIGYEWSILGGYARDLHHGVTPKDLDIVLYNIKGHELPNKEDGIFGSCPLQKLYDYLESTGMYGDEIALEAGGSEGMDGDEEALNRLHGVFKLKGNIDLIMYNEEFYSKYDVMDSFDYNINQYELVIDENGNGTSTYYGEREGLLLPVRSRLTTERAAYMHIKGCELGWISS